MVRTPPRASQPFTGALLRAHEAAALPSQSLAPFGPAVGCAPGSPAFTEQERWPRAQPVIPASLTQVAPPFLFPRSPEYVQKVMQNSNSSCSHHRSPYFKYGNL